MNPAETDLPQGSRELLELLRNMYPGWEVGCRRTRAGVELWTARRRAVETVRSRQIGVIQCLATPSGPELGEALDQQVELMHNCGFHRWEFSSSWTDEARFSGCGDGSGADFSSTDEG